MNGDWETDGKTNMKGVEMKKKKKKKKYKKLKKKKRNRKQSYRICEIICFYFGIEMSKDVVNKRKIPSNDV